MASIFIRTAIIYILLAFSLKIMGKRQIGELEVSELISTLLVSEVAALPIADPDIPLLNAIIPVLFIVSLEIIISYLKNKNERLKRVIEGEPIFIIFRGELNQGALLENRISVNELMCETRGLGFGSISDVYYAILEPNGKISAFGKDDGFRHGIIIDRHIDIKALKRIGYDGDWLNEKIKESGNALEDIFLFTVDDSGDVEITKRS